MKQKAPQQERAMGRIRWTLAVLALVAAVGTAQADQTPVDVSSVRQIRIGPISPGEDRVINYGDVDAAQFTISGMENRKVRISVEIEDLVALTGTPSDEQSNSLSLVITGFDCAYSLDNGETWTQFTTAALEEVVQLPKSDGAGKIGTVLLRIGGAVTAGLAQQRGAYRGNVIVRAEYATNSNTSGPDSQGKKTPSLFDDDMSFDLDNLD